MPIDTLDFQRPGVTMSTMSETTVRALPELTLSQEPLSEALEHDIAPLLKKHYTEIAHYPDIPLDPDWPTYYAAQKIGALRVYTARRGPSLVGYVVYFVRPNLHYKTSLQANQDILFLDPSERGKTLGLRLIKFADEKLRQDGVQVVYQHVKVAHDFGPMLERIGYTFIDKIYGRRLD